MNNFRSFVHLVQRADERILSISYCLVDWSLLHLASPVASPYAASLS